MTEHDEVLFPLADEQPFALQAVQLQPFRLYPTEQAVAQHVVPAIKHPPPSDMHWYQAVLLPVTEHDDMLLPPAATQPF